MVKKRIRPTVTVNCNFCNKEFLALKYKVLSGIRKYCSKKCSCLGRRENLVGRKFGKLTVISHSHMNKFPHGTSSMWNVVCECGNKKVVQSSALKRGATKSCGCLVFEKVSKRFGESCSNQHYNVYKQSAKKRGLTFELDFETFKNLILDDCIYCGGLPEFRQMKKGTHGVFPVNGIDRINNKLGYIKNNVASCCKICNRMKMALEAEYFLYHIEKIHNFQTEKKISIRNFSNIRHGE